MYAEEGNLAPDLKNIRRSSLVDVDGQAYPDFRRTLLPRYGIAWSHITLGWLVVVAVGIGLVLGGRYVEGSVLGEFALSVIGAVILGFSFHFLLQFQHEGAHYHLAPKRVTNDRLTNAFVGIVVGEDVRNYRKIHLDHHRYLGTTKDSERSYFDALDSRFLLQGLLGLRLLRIIAARRANLDTRTASGNEDSISYFTPVFLLALLFNGAVVAGAVISGAWVLAASWVSASFMFLPLINATRQVLEHRSELADRTVDYSKVPHGAVNRIFGDGPLPAMLGPAGFNRHLLHHWDAGIPYTRLRELETYLLQTPFAAMFSQYRTTYPATLRCLISR